MESERRRRGISKRTESGGDATSYTDPGFYKAMNSKTNFNHAGSFTRNLFDATKTCGNGVVKATGVLSGSIDIGGFHGSYGLWKAGTICDSFSIWYTECILSNSWMGEIRDYHVTSSSHKLKASLDIDMDATYDYSDTIDLFNQDWPAWSSGIFSVKIGLDTKLDIKSSLEVNMDSTLVVDQDTTPTTHYHYKHLKNDVLVDEFRDVEPRSASRSSGGPPGPSIELTADIKININLSATLHLDLSVTAEVVSKKFMSITGGLKKQRRILISKEIPTLLHKPAQMVLVSLETTICS